MKWAFVAGYLFAGITVSSAYVEIYRHTCVTAHPSLYALVGAIWPIAGVLAVTKQLTGNPSPNYCGGI